MFSFLVLRAKTQLQNFFGRLVKNVLVLSTVTFWLKLVFWRFVFFSLRQFECKFYACWQNKVSAVVRKTFLCQQDFFGRKYPFEIFKVFLSFSYFERNVLSLSVGKSWNNCENSILRILNIIFLAKTKTNWKFPKMLKFFVYSEKKFAKKFWQTCQKCTYIVNSNILRKSKFLKFCFFSLWDFGLNFLCPIPKKIIAVVQTYSRMYATIFSEKSVFFLNFSKLFIVLVLWAKVSEPVGWKNKEGLPNQPYTCGEHHSDEKLKNPQRYSFRVFTAEIVAEDPLADLSKLYLSCTQKHFEEIFFSEAFFCFPGIWV